MGARHRRFTYDTDRLARAVAARGWTFSDVARLLGDISDESVRRFLIGQSHSPRLAFRIAGLLNVDLDDYVLAQPESVPA